MAVHLMRQINYLHWDKHNGYKFTVTTYKFTCVFMVVATYTTRRPWILQIFSTTSNNEDKINVLRSLKLNILN